MLYVYILNILKCQVERAAAAELFKELESSDSKVLRVRCLFCLSGVVKTGTRSKTHIEQCLSFTKLLKQKYLDGSCKIMAESDS